MTLYHGSSVIVETPELRYFVRALDFGRGFYTTTNEYQTVQCMRKIYEKKYARKGTFQSCV
jgi:hypothetical protein